MSGPQKYRLLSKRDPALRVTAIPEEDKVSLQKLDHNNKLQVWVKAKNPTPIQNTECFVLFNGEANKAIQAPVQPGDSLLHLIPHTDPNVPPPDHLMKIVWTAGKTAEKTTDTDYSTIQLFKKPDDSTPVDENGWTVLVDENGVEGAFVGYKKIEQPPNDNQLWAFEEYK